MRSPRREPARVEGDGIRDAAPARPARRRKRWLRRATAAARSHSPRSVSEPDRAAQQALGGGWETSPTLVGDRFAPHPANDLAIRDRCRYRVQATAPGCDRVRPDLGVPRLPQSTIWAARATPAIDHVEATRRRTRRLLLCLGEAGRARRCFRVKHASGPTPPALRSPPRPATLPRARSLRRKAGVRISAAPSSSSLALSPTRRRPGWRLRGPRRTPRRNRRRLPLSRTTGHVDGRHGRDPGCRFGPAGA
jgi:hypothetical protein